MFVGPFFVLRVIGWVGFVSVHVVWFGLLLFFCANLNRIRGLVFCCCVRVRVEFCFFLLEREAGNWHVVLAGVFRTWFSG
jgi:hypothetical protein